MNMSVLNRMIFVIMGRLWLLIVVSVILLRLGWVKIVFMSIVFLSMELVRYVVSVMVDVVLWCSLCCSVNYDGFVLCVCIVLVNGICFVCVSLLCSIWLSSVVIGSVRVIVGSISVVGFWVFDIGNQLRLKVNMFSRISLIQNMGEDSMMSFILVVIVWFVCFWMNIVMVSVSMIVISSVRRESCMVVLSCLLIILVIGICSWYDLLRLLWVSCLMNIVYCFSGGWFRFRLVLILFFMVLFI